jgi:hypothetical protein
MMPLEQDLKKRSLASGGRRTDLREGQGQPSRQPTAQKFLAHRFPQDRHSLVPHAIGRGPASRGQMNPAALVQLQEQGPGGHVFKLTGVRAPVPQLGQFHAHAPATPAGLGRQDPSDLSQLFRPDAPALDDFASVHRPSAWRIESKESRKKCNNLSADNSQPKPAKPPWKRSALWPSIAKLLCNSEKTEMRTFFGS